MGGWCIRWGGYYRWGGTTGEDGEGSGGARVCTHSATSVTEEVCVAPPARYIAGWGPSRLEVGGRLGRDCLRQAPNDGVAPPRRHGRDRGRGR